MEERRILELLVNRYPVLSSAKVEIRMAFELLCNCYENKGKLLICGNGGSASDAEHIVGELMKNFTRVRTLDAKIKKDLIAVSEELGGQLSKSLQPALPAIALTSHTALNTAFMNDVNPELIFAQQVVGYGKPGDILLGISTSGNAKNVLYALVTARALGMKTVGLTGKTGGRFNEYCDIVIHVPAIVTHEVQELHLPVYHALCQMLEEHFWK